MTHMHYLGNYTYMSTTERGLEVVPCVLYAIEGFPDDPICEWIIPGASWCCPIMEDEDDTA